MTLKELWELFPIVLMPYDPRYKEWYETQRRRIYDGIKPDMIARINHIGSSAVEGLISKPTVDMLLEIDGRCPVARLTHDLEAMGWGLMQRVDDPMRLAFNKGYTPDGFAEKVYHLHVRYVGDWDELYFRDYLMAHPDVAAEYAELKLRLWRAYEHDRDGYTEAKSEFVLKYSQEARREFGERYRAR